MTDININALAEIINEKVDLDAQNLDSTGKEYVSSLAMPYGTYDDVTILASNQTYTAPANGFYSMYVSQSSSNNYYFQLLNLTRGSFRYRAQQSNYDFCGYIPVIKGDVVKLEYNNKNSNWQLRFYYAEGEI